MVTEDNGFQRDPRSGYPQSIQARDRYDEDMDVDQCELQRSPTRLMLTADLPPAGQHLHFDERGYQDEPPVRQQVYHDEREFEYSQPNQVFDRRYQPKHRNEEESEQYK